VVQGVTAALLLACATLTCPFSAENGLFWEPSPTATGYRVYVSSQTSPPFLLHDQIPCGKLFLIDDTPFCHFHPVKRFVDAAFPVEPGVAAVFYVSAVNSAGESDLSNGVGIVLVQTIMLAGG